MGTLQMTAPAPGTPGGEGIWHLFPVQGKSYAVGSTLTANGVWRGNNGGVYQIRFKIERKGPGGEDFTEVLNPPTGELAGTGRALSWTGRPFEVLNLRRHVSWALLYKMVNGEWSGSPVRTSDIWFQARF